ncbi:MAG: cation:proton antiporter [Brevinematales bacterium]|nr:cation:proton antiporter [Brevinematales bacterium]
MTFHIDTITGIFLVFLVSAIFLYIFGRFQVPFIVSLILSGIVLNQIGVLNHNEVFKEIADFGVMLMLFFVGVEFSLRILWSYRKEVVLIGLGQIVLTSILPLTVLWLITKDFKVAFVLSSVIVMSSTITILSIVEKKGAIGIRYGRITFLISLIQDIVSILILVALSFIVNTESSSANLFVGSLIVILYFVALYYFTKTRFAEILVVRDRYLIVFLAIVISFGSATVAKFSGLSPFLGAFIAGMIISESFFGRQIASEVLPIKEIFVGFFFVYIGASITLSLLIKNFSVIILTTLCIVVFKFLVMFLILLANRESVEHNLRSSSLISSMGEFGFLILSISLRGNVISDDVFVIFSSSIVLSMILSSLSFQFVDRIADRISILKIKEWNKGILGKFDVIIVGFGPVGRKVTEILINMNVPHVILETNSETVRKNRKVFNIHFGDAKRESTLRWVGIENSKLLVITTPVKNESLTISETARALNPNINIVARARFTSEAESLRQNRITNVLCDEEIVADYMVDFIRNSYFLSSGK